MSGIDLRQGDRLLILGASARAAAQSAWRAGLAPVAADLFADADLAALCPVVKVTDYPRGLESASKCLPAGPWIYTGGLENHPALVDRVAKDRPLLGNPGAVLRSVRSPWRVSQALADCGLPFARIAPPRERPTAGDWLAKPLRGSGGRGISVWSPSMAGPREGYYLQELLEGPSYSAIFVASAGSSQLLGVTRQLTGAKWLAASPFAYCGSIGPVRLEPESADQWELIGECLTAKFGLRGMFGVDAVVTSRGIVPVEVNPRYTASAEVLERACAASFLQLHIAACANRTFTAPSAPSAGVFGKAVIYARRQAAVCGRLQLLWGPPVAPSLGLPYPTFADLPWLGSRIEAGAPIATAFGHGPNEEEVVVELNVLANRIYAALDDQAAD